MVGPCPLKRDSGVLPALPLTEKTLFWLAQELVGWLVVHFIIVIATL